LRSTDLAIGRAATLLPAAEQRTTDAHPIRRTPIYAGGVTTRDTAERAVSWLLDGIRDIRYLDVVMPHGYEVEALDFEEAIDPFAASLRHWRASATVRVPVLWTPVNGRATAPPARDNVEEFRRLIEDNAPYAPARRLRLVSWTVTPDEFLELPAHGEPAADWAVRLALDVL
jgi:hypothetical protein